jgi:hypothetical protein
MSYSVGDGMVVLGLAAGIVGYIYVQHQTRRKRLEIIHQERMAAMEKGIPLPEFPLEPVRATRPPDPTVLPIMGLVMLTLSIGTMIVLCVMFPAARNGAWVAPLPLAFLGIGLLGFHLMKRDAGR